jgi:S1-C subfamily serine protease
MIVIASLLLLAVAVIFSFGHTWHVSNKLTMEFVAQHEQSQEHITSLIGEVNKLKQSITLQEKAQDEKLKSFEKKSNDQLKDISTQLLAVEELGAKRIEDLQVQLSSQGKGGVNLAAIAERALKSVASVETTGGKGSGTIVTDDGYILTNKHVIEGASIIVVTLSDGTRYKAELVATSSRYDLALLETGTETRGISFANSDNAKPGQTVLALGNPAGLSFTVTDGIISAAQRTGRDNINYIQTDVTLNPGNSGGPIIDVQGRLIGITTLKAKGLEGIGFAIPANDAKRFVESTLSRKI